MGFSVRPSQTVLSYKKSFCCKFALRVTSPSHDSASCLYLHFMPLRPFLSLRFICYAETALLLPLLDYSVENKIKCLYICGVFVSFGNRISSLRDKQHNRNIQIYDSGGFIRPFIPYLDKRYFVPKEKFLFIFKMVQIYRRQLK